MKKKIAVMIVEIDPKTGAASYDSLSREEIMEYALKMKIKPEHLFVPDAVKKPN